MGAWIVLKLYFGATGNDNNNNYISGNLFIVAADALQYKLIQSQS